ncbi:unnamed protein product [Darwinula stevensoni]|uniref:Fibrinogen C-terminal domain-containing protein n=1 Tax=Darwinula stevensoni TaxID=69355 RepID=A0A7R8XA77_9CRUS|nr:unnamed protein product [Darwinula stevensoni]CAG0883474.1 unnamed protein product [Darwinula stevensoni]
MDSLCALYIFTALLLSSFPYGKGADVRGKGNHNETGNMIELLQRISEEMPTLSGLRNSIGVALENLHTLDFRLTQVEMQGKDQQTAARAEWQSQNRVLETLNWEISKISTLTEVLRQDLHTLNQAVLEVKFHLNHEEPANKSLALGVERVSSNKLRLMSATLISLKGSLATMESAMTGIVQNVTYITNISRALDGRLRQTVTRSDLHNKLLDLKDHMQPHHCPSPLPSGTNERVPRSCSEVAAEMPSGIYLLQPKGLLKPWFAYCDMKTQDGGWTVMHHRYEGQQEFYRDWHDYKHGFGNLGGEFWLGLEKIHLLTSQEVCELRIELEDFDGVKVVASYEAFAVGSEVEGYSLKLLGKYDGDAGLTLFMLLERYIEFSYWSP